MNAATLTAAIAATVAEVNGDAGQYVSGGTTASGGATTGASNSSGTSATGFVLLTNLNALLVVAQVNEADMAKIALGDPVQFIVDAFPGQNFAGKVTVIEPVGVITNNIVNYNVTSSINPTQTNLLPGMTADVNIITASADHVLTVPAAAVSYARSQELQQTTTSVATSQDGRSSATSAPTTRQRSVTSARTRQGSPAAVRPPATRQSGGALVSVLVMTNGKPVRKAIQVGLSDGRNTQVLSGLTAGQTVVIGVGSSTSFPASGIRQFGGGPPLGGRGFGG
jgi:multidrug efflux pump subunit AcrA (membrane-fusion protein)